MQQLAAFEDYLADFRVTVADLETRGFSNAPQFDLLVACLSHKLCGYAVLVYQPFTYDLTPVATLKELYVEADYRGSGAGQALFQAAIQTARNKGANRLNWLVLKHNLPAQQFYQQQGGHQSKNWIRFEKNL
jgi:diamine N-acetyltransferase